MNMQLYSVDQMMVDDDYDDGNISNYEQSVEQFPALINLQAQMNYMIPPMNYMINPPDHNSQRKKRLKEFSNSLIKEDPKYIADNFYAIQIVQELTNSGLCKISNFVNGHYQTQLEQILKYEKHLQDTRQDQSIQKQIFFINTNPQPISFQDDHIVYRQIPPTLVIDQSLKTKYQYLLTVVNLTTRLLESSFIKDFQFIINHYINLKEKEHSNNGIIEFLQNEIEKNPEQYSYISKWMEVKSKLKPVLVIYKQIKILEKKDELCGRKSLKVLSKHIKKIDKLQKRLQQEQILSPLEFLFSNLFEIFDSILKFYEENYEKVTHPQPQETIKKNKSKQAKHPIQEASVQECEQGQFQYQFQKKQIKQQERIAQQFDCQFDVLSAQSQSLKKKIKEQKSE